MYFFLTRVVALLALLPALAGCSLFFDEAPGIPAVRFYNNSGRDVLVDDSRIKPGRSATVAFPAQQNQPLIVFSSGCLYTYLVESRPSELRGTDWLMRLSYRLQLEPDGRLYGLPDGVRFPADVTKLQQPEGFPLVPRDGSTCQR